MGTWIQMQAGSSQFLKGQMGLYSAVDVSVLKTDIIFVFYLHHSHDNYRINHGERILVLAQ